ncbi:MAG: hypothetical protein Greene101449_321, partial [Candidatus Peregrinibacteria bacterium Greene1014_49]
MRRLIVNADDLGINAPRTHGIFACMDQGIVRSATLIPNMADSEAAIRHCKERGIGIGLHINLSEGAALSNERDIATLLDPSGFLMGKIRTRKALDENTIDPTHLERELRAQLEWCLDHYGQPTHVDGHQHLHIHPAVAPVLAPILSRYGITIVRVPKETLERLPWEIPEERAAWIAMISGQASHAQEIFSSLDLRTTDHFRGMALSGEANARKFRHLLCALPEGTTELMVHPGACDPAGDDFSRDPQRETERNMLCDPDLPALLQSRGIEL